jgi:hypothetical protein
MRFSFAPIVAHAGYLVIMNHSIPRDKHLMKRSLRILLYLLALLALTAAVLAFAELSVRWQRPAPVTSRPPDLPTNSSFVSVRLDEGLFTLFAALNAAGYVDENFGLDYHPVRQQVRDALAGRSFSGMERLRSQLGFVGSYNFAVWSLHFGPPPDFGRVQPGWDLPNAPALLFLGMDDLLRDFYDEMDIGVLWREVRPEYGRVAVLYQEAAGEAVQDALDYTRMADAPMRNVVIIPNLLDAHYRGYGPQVGETAYVVVGPTEGELDTGLIQHEALHSIVGPLVEAHLSAIDADQSRALYRSLRGRVPASYGSWEIIVEEQVVRALDCRLAGPACFEFILDNHEAEGFLLVRPLVEKLAEFEASSLSLDAFMPELLGVLNQVNLPQP